MIPISTRLPLPTDLSPYLLVGSASGTTLSLGAFANSVPAGGWAGALIAVLSLAGNLYLDRQKRRRREAEETARKDLENRVLFVFQERLKALELGSEERKGFSDGVIATMARLESKVDGLAARDRQ